MPRGCKFTVTGKGSFPTDMLRRDACWPAASEDASWLLHPKYQDDVDPDTTNPMVEVNREVTLMTSNLSPTTDRWRSFGWRVTKTEKL